MPSERLQRRIDALLDQSEEAVEGSRGGIDSDEVAAEAFAYAFVWSRLIAEPVSEDVAA